MGDRTGTPGAVGHRLFFCLLSLLSFITLDSFIYPSVTPQPFILHLLRILFLIASHSRTSCLLAIFSSSLLLLRSSGLGPSASSSSSATAAAAGDLVTCVRTHAHSLNHASLF